MVVHGHHLVDNTFLFLLGRGDRIEGVVVAIFCFLEPNLLERDVGRELIERLGHFIDGPSRVARAGAGRWDDRRPGDP